MKSTRLLSPQRLPFRHTGGSDKKPNGNSEFSASDGHSDITLQQREKPSNSLAFPNDPLGDVREAGEQVKVAAHASNRQLCAPRRCEQCGTLFQTRADEQLRGRGKFCGSKCANVARAKMMQIHNAAMRQCPEGEKSIKIRANGLINSRVKRGATSRPTACAKCGNPGRVDAHHSDYQSPHRVAFLCRSCHMKAHHDPAFEIACRDVCVEVGSLPGGTKGGAK